MVVSFLKNRTTVKEFEELPRVVHSCLGYVLGEIIPIGAFPQKEETDNPSVVNSDLDSIRFLCLSFDVWNVIYELSSHCFYGQK